MFPLYMGYPEIERMLHWIDSMQLPAYWIFVARQEIALKPYEEIERVNTVFALTIDGVCVSNGLMRINTPTTLRSLTITE